MKLQHSQRGVTLVSIAFYLGLLAFVVFTALKLFPVYMESFTITSSVEGLQAEGGAEAFVGAGAVKQAVVKRFGVNNISLVTGEDVIVVRDENIYTINVEYEVRIPFIKNIDLVLFFENNAEVLAR